MYSTKTATTNNTEFGSSYIPVGINENVNLKSVTVEKSPTNKDFIRITFEKDGKEVSFTEWKNEKNMWIKTDEDLQRRDDVQFGRLLQIIDCYYATRPEFEGSSFLEMITWVAAKLNDVINSADPKPALRLKVVYDKNGYTTVSKNGLYVESMTVSKEESQIKLWKNDLLERPVQPDKEDDPLGTPTGEAIPVTADSNTGADDLPF